MKIQIFSIFPSIQIEHMLYSFHLNFEELIMTYLENAQIAHLLSVAQEYQKKERTALRKPEAHEIGR